MIPTEPIGSIPRPPELAAAFAAGVPWAQLEALCGEALRDTVARFEATGSPVITDGEQCKLPNFWTYPVFGAPNTAPDGFPIPLSGRRTRRMLRLTSGPFHFQRYADQFLRMARHYATVPVKQAVISASALSLMYPPEGIDGYPREQFLDDLLREHETEIRRCLEAGAYKVQVDFTEGRLALQLDPDGALLGSFIDLNNLALGRFSPEERALIGVYACSGAGLESGADGAIDYCELLPSLFELKAGSFYIALAGEPNPRRMLEAIRACVKPGQRVFVGVTAPPDARIETPEQVRDRVLEAAEYIAPAQLGTTDDCGFAPFCDDSLASREAAFAKIRARVEGTALAAAILEGRG
jgi:5-methyltetrahydropteroyltriglutamate--homocysteine methyltransferase